MSRIPIGSQEVPAGIRNPRRSGGKRIISAQPLEGRGLGSSSTIPPVMPSGWRNGVHLMMVAFYTRFQSIFGKAERGERRRAAD